MLKVDTAADGTVSARDPEGGRFDPASVHDIPPSPEYSTLTPDIPTLSVADHETPTDCPGETEEYPGGVLMLTEGGKRSDAAGVGKGVADGTTCMGAVVGVGEGFPAIV